MEGRSRPRRATVIGAGVMGAAIAAHLANAGVPVWLLDVVPEQLAEEERRRGRTLADPEVRSRLSRAGKERALRAAPPAFMAPELASLVTPGNVEDDLHHVRESDWVIEAVIERLDAKRALLANVERHWRPGTIVSSNTSGLSINAMAEGRSGEFRRHFLGTHFFNPPRYMRLVEIIPTAATAAEAVDAAREYLEGRLGKGIVLAKDTPNFIGNRIGAFTSCLAVRLALDGGYTVEEVDALTGPLIGRPRTGTFRLADLVGLDTAYHVRRNVYENLPDDPDREVFDPPEPLRRLVERGWLGAKSGRGFYWRRGDATLALDLATLEYRPQQTPDLPSAAAVATIADIGERLRTLLRHDDRASVFVWQLLGRTLAYAARVLPEISDDVVNVDRAMRWGFSWQLGPFELWDALGPREVAARLAREGAAVPPVVEQVIRRGDGRFYRETETGLQFFDFAGPAYRSLGSPVPHSPASVARNAAAPGAAPPRDPRPLEGNAEASLRELGDRVAYVELHPKSNAIGSDAVRLLETALDRLDEDFDALVVRAKGRDFSASPQALRELFALAEERQWQAADEWVRRRQEIVRRIRGSAQPVVIAAAGRTLGWGAALCLAAPRVQAAAETSIGFTEIEAGLIPAGGGTVELIRRSQARIPADVAADLLPFVQWVFEPVARAKTSQSAFDARRLGYLADADGITMNPERLLHDAKMAALALLQGDYRPPLPAPVRVGGERVRAALREFLHIARTGGHITEFDEAVGRRLAHVMAGGGVPEGSVVGDDYLFDLEREAFLALLGEEKTRARLRHVEQTGRPFRN